MNLATKARPYLGAVVLTSALLTAGGIYSATRMASGVYPEVTFQRIAVIARVPNYDVAQMEVKVTRPLEEAINGVLGVANIRSRSIRGGAEISIDFSPGTDIRRAETLVWNRIGAKRSDLPPNVELKVEQMTPSVFPIISLALVGGDSPAQLRDYAEFQLAPLIKTIPDVQYAEVAGGDVREIEVIARPDDLLAAGLSAADLADQIGQQCTLHPVGRTEGQPFAFQLIVNNQPETTRQIEEMVISSRKDQPLRVRDVADVKVGHKDRGLSIGYDQKDAVVITVFRRLNGNAVNISRNLQALLDKNRLALPIGDEAKRPPRNIQAVIVYDQSTFVTTSVHNVRDAIVIGGLFSILIILAFLRSGRAMLISALAIPTTLAITFLFLHWSGETLNLMSLGGLAVAIGLIIDDTVVVVENIARHLLPGRHKPAAVVLEPAIGAVEPANGHAKSVPAAEADPVDAASSEITGAVVGSTLTTVLVFLPLAFIVGVYGQFFASLSWSLSIAVLVSMVISLTLVPVVAAKFLGGRPMPGPGRLYGLIERVYSWGLTLALRFPWISLILSMVVVAIGIVLVLGIPDPKDPTTPYLKGLETGLMPAMDEGAFVFDYYAPTGTPLEQTEKMAQDVEKVLAKNPDVAGFVRRTGAENGLFATQTSRGDIQVVLRPAENDPVSLLTKRVRPPMEDLEKELKARGKSLEDPKTREEVRATYRRRPLTKVMEEVEDQVKDQYGEHQLKIELIQIMADELSDLSGANKPIEVKLIGPDNKVLRDLAKQVGEILEKKGQGRGIKEVTTNVFDGNPDLFIQLDSAKVERYGLKPDGIARQLSAMFLGQIAARAQESAIRLTDVRVRYPDSIRFGPDTQQASGNNGRPADRRFDAEYVRRQWIVLPPGAPAANGDSQGLLGPARAVTLGDMATVKPVRSPDQVFREGMQPAIFVTAELNEEEAGLGSVVKDVRAWMSEVNLPAGYRWELGGHYLRMQEAFESLLVVMVVAVLLVFIMLAFQFQSVTLPVLIFLTQPLSLVSGLLALWLTKTPLNVSSYMGAILLIGLDMKNGILLVEYIQQLRGGGMELRPALIEAGRTRFRPILMTSLAAVLGLSPLALGIGPGAQMQQPLAIMVIGGLTANMLFTRMMIPVGYLLWERTWTRKNAATVKVVSPPPVPEVPAPKLQTMSLPESVVPTAPEPLPTAPTANGHPESEKVHVGASATTDPGGVAENSRGSSGPTAGAVGPR